MITSHNAGRRIYVLLHRRQSIGRSWKNGYKVSIWGKVFQKQVAKLASINLLHVYYGSRTGRAGRMDGSCHWSLIQSPTVFHWSRKRAITVKTKDRMGCLELQARSTKLEAKSPRASQLFAMEDFVSSASRRVQSLRRFTIWRGKPSQCFRSKS